MTSAELITIIARLESATEGSRELDGEVHFQAVCPEGEAAITVANERNRGNSIPEYSTSLDAALALVPPGLRWEVVGNSFGGTRGVAAVSDGYPSGTHYYGQAATPALAICIAALMARQRTMLP